MDFPNLSAAKYIVIDLETRDPHIKEMGPGWATGDGEVAGIALGADGLPARYYPIGHAFSKNLNKEHVLQWVQDVFDNTRCDIVGHNLGYDLGWLQFEGIRIPPSLPTFCTMVGAALLDEDRTSYSLDNLGKDWCGESKSEEGIKAYADAHGFDAKADLWKMPPEVVAPYACQDVDLTVKLYLHEKVALDHEGLEAITQLEMSLIPMLVEMRRRGVRIDVNALEQAEADLRARETAILAELETTYGTRVNPWQATSIARLCECRGIRYPRSSGARPVPSFTAAWLKAQIDPALALVLRARRINKARGTFLKAYSKFQVNGRLHASINQLRSDSGGTITGRLSYTDPNLQQVPIRDPDLGPVIRRLFLPEEGASWINSDYGQQEPRLVVHYAHLLKLEGAAEVVAQFRADPRTDLHNVASEITGIERQIAKHINMGIIFGMGPKKFATTHGVTEAFAREKIQLHTERLPFMRGLAQVACNRAEEKGQITTMLGRKARFELYEPVGREPGTLPLPRAAAEERWPGRSLKRGWGHTAISRLISGSAADQTKRAMANMWQEGICPMIQIHDAFETSGDEALARRIEEIMTDAVKLEVPTVVDTKIGKNWAEA